MVRVDVVSHKITRAMAWLQDAEELLARPREEFLADVKGRDLATVGLRNRIAHGYAAVDHGRVQSEFQEGTSALRRFLARVASEAGLAG
jgi:uncharacterized protein YutE (UPF0331/DUF86 family)